MFLINGFGIEKKESYTIYTPELMPNFTTLMQKYMFTPLVSDVKNINDGYRNMSLEINGLYNYNVYSRETESGNLLNNNTILDIKKEMEERKSKLHIFCFVDNKENIIDNLEYFFKIVNRERDKKIFLHVVLTSNNYEEYPEILEVLSKINIELKPYAQIGMILGLSTILNSNPIPNLNFFLRNLISELGEKWQSFKQKLDVSFGMKTSPQQVTPFVVNTGFSIKEDDMVLVWNYDNINLTNFITGITSINYGEGIDNKIKFYSLFPITYKEAVPYIINSETSSVSLASAMKGLGFKSLIVANKNSINGINYYLNGMQMVNNPDITFMAMEDILYNKDLILNIINTYPQELMIFNYDVTSAKTVEELLSILKNIDDVLGAVYTNTEKNSYAIVISSLYGMNRSMYNDKGEFCNIIYSKVPIIYANNFLTKKNYLINEGRISDLLKICYMSISKEYLGVTIIQKKNLLYRLLFK